MKASTTYFCDFCGYENNSNHKYCPSCGCDNDGIDRLHIKDTICDHATICKHTKSCKHGEPHKSGVHCFPKECCGIRQKCVKINF